MSLPLRILAVSDVSPAVVSGGGERVLWEQAARLAGRGHRIRILSRSPVAGAPEAAERDGVAVRHFGVDRRSPLRLLRSSILEARRAAAEELDGGDADVLHVYQPLSGFGVLGSPAGRRMPSLYSFLSPAPLEYRSRRGMTGHHRGGWSGGLAVAFLWNIERACLRRATRIHVLSRFSADQLRRMYRIREDRMVQIPGAVDTERYRPAPHRAAVREALGIPNGRPLFLTVRNLEARMGLDSLIRAMAIVRRQAPDALLLVGGDGALRAALEALAVSLALQGYVRFLGFIPEAQLPLYYQAADAFVLPTRELEGFGLVTVEALACGTPVLGTPVGATPEILRPLDSSLIFRTTTPEAIAQGLRDFLAALRDDPGARERLRRACRRHAEAHYAWESSVSRLEALLCEVAVGTARPGSSAQDPAERDGV